MALRVIFCGTPEFAVPSLRALTEAEDISVEAVITQPDRPRGRGQEMASSPVKEFALGAGLHVFQPEKIKSESAENFIRKIEPDAIAIVAYGQIIPQRLIEIPRLGWINVHASLLPKYRGAAPIQWAIVNGESVTGVTTMQIDTGLDTGPMLERAEIAIGSNETAPELSKRLAAAGGPLLVSTLRKLALGEIQPAPQDNSLATLARPLKKEDGKIDWRMTAQEIDNRMRGLEPWPGTYTTFRGQTCQIWAQPAEGTVVMGVRTEGMQPGTIVQAFPGSTPALPGAAAGSVFVVCGKTQLRLEFVRLEGRKKISARDFVNGARLQPGDKFDL